ncbi:hypothetical protein [Streptomyces daliensis]|uniref:Uncharacterized protein n=1 Tax=Streptomyces daliensis TaxID=299421 RepID=A0A8T4IHK3_9ACTN|nr:hypothetical protein [Streptomyces daliensis]
MIVESLPCEEGGPSRRGPSLRLSRLSRLLRCDSEGASEIDVGLMTRGVTVDSLLLERSRSRSLLRSRSSRTNGGGP